MSTRIDPHRGTWNQPEDINFPSISSEPSKSNQRKVIAISVVACAAIGSVAAAVAAGLLLYFNVNMIATWSLFGSSGGVLLIGTVVGGIIFYMRTRRVEEESMPPNIYRIVSWNVATMRDYSNMCFIKKKMNDGEEFLNAYNSLTTDKVPDASEEEKEARVELFREAFLQFETPDIICLQESWQMGSDELKLILPEGYSMFSCETEGLRDCTIIWNDEKFSKINDANLIYDPEYISTLNSAPDTVVLLRDRTDGTTVCVASAHLRGFSLAYNTLEEAQKRQELKKAEVGDNQARYDLDTMEAIQADLYIFAGDLNVTEENYPDRLEIIREYGYVNDEWDCNPTIYDANLKAGDGKAPLPAKLDHIFVKGRRGISADISSMRIPGTSLDDFNRPSDHLPIIGEVGFNKPTLSCA